MNELKKNTVKKSKNKKEKKSKKILKKRKNLFLTNQLKKER